MKELEALIRRGALLSAFGTRYPVGAAVVRGNVVVWAEQGAHDQHQVHRTNGITLKTVSPDMIDWWNPDGSLFGTLEVMDHAEAEEFHLADWQAWLADPTNGLRWREFFADEVEELLQD